MAEQLLSQKYANYNYAPGIATYGIDGKTGQAGNDGNNIYFTDYNINDENENLSDLLQKILNNCLPIKGTDVKINRPYKQDDIFFDKNGVIYKLINTNINVSSTEWKDYFTIVGEIHINDDNNYFKFASSNRLILNSDNYSGYDVFSEVNAEDANNYINKDAAVNIVSSKVDENDNIELVRMQSIDDIDVEDGKMSILYKTTENAFYVDSNKPVVINGDLKVENDNNVNNEYDNFSTVLTSDDPITYFKYICDKLQYNILYDDSKNLYKLIIYSTEENENDQIKTLEYLLNRNETVFGKIYTADNDQILIPINIIGSTSIDSSQYYDNAPSYIITDEDIIDISTNEFTIIGDGTSITFPDNTFIVGTSMSNKNLPSIDIYQTVEGLSLYGEATPQHQLHMNKGSMVDSNGLIENPTEPQTGLYGIKFNGGMNVHNQYSSDTNYILIQPLVPIDETYELRVDVWFDQIPEEGHYSGGAPGLYIENVHKSGSELPDFIPFFGQNGIGPKPQRKNTYIDYYHTYNYDVFTCVFKFNDIINQNDIFYYDPETLEISPITQIDKPIYIGVNHTNTRIKSIKICKTSSEETTNESQETVPFNILGISSINVGQLNNVNEYKLNSDNTIEQTDDVYKMTKSILTNNDDGIYKFTFNNDDFNTEDKFIKFNILPNISYIGNAPISFTLNLSNALNNIDATNTNKINVYFETIYDNDNDHLEINNIMVSNKDYLIPKQNIEKPCIQAYIPNYVKSVQKFSLLHNTEIFIQYIN